MKTNEHRCGKCGKEYTTDEYCKLERVPVDPENSDYGVHAVCSCGYEFYKDRWQLRETIEVCGIKVDISTVDLQMNHGHGDGPDLWFETMIFPRSHEDGSSVECWFCDRYTTKEEATTGHKKIKEILQSDDCKLIPSQYRLVLPDEG